MATYRPTHIHIACLTTVVMHCSVYFFHFCDSSNKCDSGSGHTNLDQWQIQRGDGDKGHAAPQTMTVSRKALL